MGYTVFDSNDPDNVYGCGLTAVDAMDLILTDDGYRYEIRKTGFRGSLCWVLYHSDGSANSTRGARNMVETLISSFAADEDSAKAEIAESVIAADWPRVPTAKTDSDFDAMLAQAAE